jgi:hypothetical protein
MDIAPFILLTFIIIIFVNTIYSTKYKVVNMPSAPNTRRAIIDDIRLLKGSCDGLNIYDCGSGWGGLCGKLSKSFPTATVTGIEISPIPFFVSRINPFRKYTVKRDNLFDVDLSQVDLLIFYLSPHHMANLVDKLKGDTKNKVVIYSQGFPIPEWEPSKIITIPYALENKLYRYDL